MKKFTPVYNEKLPLTSAVVSTLVEDMEDTYKLSLESLKVL